MEKYHIRKTELPPRKAKRKVLETFQKILTSSLLNGVIKVDKTNESITFHTSTNAFIFFEKISAVFPCNLVVNELSVFSDVYHLKDCEIHLTEDNILCEIHDTKTPDPKQTETGSEKNENITDEDTSRLENILTDEPENGNLIIDVNSTQNEEEGTSSAGLKSLIEVCEKPKRN